MPELPEVETTVRGLRAKVKGKTIEDVWTDFERIVKKPKKFSEFKKQIKGSKIKKVGRKGKNILIYLSKNRTLLIHQKMTGHLLVGQWEKENQDWVAKSPGPLKEDSYNQYLHLIFFLDSSQQLALSNMRKFARVELWDSKQLKSSPKIQKIGPDPLSSEFTFQRFKKALNQRTKGAIKSVLMDQKVIAGIGNIYSSEALWEAKVNPFKDFSDLSEKELKKVFQAIKKVLRRGIELNGASYSDYRKVNGGKGKFQEWGRVYGREGEKCKRCGEKIEREKINGRSAYFCPSCQHVKS